jgi:hypothetical protein
MVRPWTNNGQRHHRPEMSSASIWTNTVGTKCPGQGLWGGLITQRSRVQIPSPRRDLSAQANGPVLPALSHAPNIPPATVDQELGEGARATGGVTILGSSCAPLLGERDVIEGASCRVFVPAVLLRRRTRPAPAVSPFDRTVTNNALDPCPCGAVRFDADELVRSLELATRPREHDGFVDEAGGPREVGDPHILLSHGQRIDTRTTGPARRRRHRRL